MKKIATIIISLLSVTIVQAQKVTFYSAEFEEGVKAHLKFGEADEVLQIHTDTITRLDLSGLGITDIRDAVYLTNVTELNLSGNDIRDLSSLLPLEKLRVLDVSNNALEDVSVLAFSCSDRMTVHLESNYIEDFSNIYSLASCELTLVGMKSQRVKSAPYFDVYQLYGSVDDKDGLVVSYRGYTNMAAAAVLRCGSYQTAAVMDGETYIHAVKTEGRAAAKVTLSNGEKEEATYVVPTADFIVQGGGTTKVGAGLPEDYQLTYAKALHGTAQIVDNKVQYTAPASAPADTVYFSYYKGSELKGFSRFYFNRSQILPGDVNGDGMVSNSDVVAVLNRILGGESDNFNEAAADVNKDGIITITDALIIVDMIHNQ